MSDPDVRDDGGEITEEDVLRAVRERTAQKPVTTAPELAEDLPVSRRTVLNRLRLLERSGDVESHQFGARTVVWWPVAGEAAPVSDAGASREEPEPHASDVEPVTTDRQTDTERKEAVYEGLSDEPDIGDRVAAVVEDVADSWEDTEERLATRKAAAKAVLQHALDTGDAVGKSSEIVEDVRRRYPVEDQKPETYWRKNIRPVLKETGEYSQSKHGYIVKELGGEN